MFNGFIRVRGQWQKIIHKIFEEFKDEKGISFTWKLVALYEKAGRMKASFFSKLLTTLKPVIAN